MCGIYGSFEFASANGADRALMSRMGRVITHRGPDDEGAYVEPGVALGMRRLSIIDLSGGHQPIANEDESVWVVCNGEIYNFLDLRRDLESAGHRFRCNSDTEVLVHLYEQYGDAFVERLRGMFGFALWDRRRRRLIIGRDRLGKKPVYYFADSSRIVFGSEIKSLLEAGIPREPDYEAVPQYLTFGFVPAPRTMFRGISKLLPGHLLIVENGDVRQRPYWDVNFAECDSRPEAEWAEQVRAKLLESVRIRMISDVPLGAFLSGGIDSSSIIAGMAQFSEQPVKTYSIGFAGEDKYYDELPYARIVADKFKTDHHEIVVRPQVAELLPKLIWHLDEPIADSASITTYLVAKLARESVTVILSGVGGDELFGGYRRYLGDSIARYYALAPRPLRRTLLPKLIAKLPQDRHSAFANLVRQAAAVVEADPMTPFQRYVRYTTVFGAVRLGSLLQDGAHAHHGALELADRYFSNANCRDTLSRTIYADMKMSLADDLLALTDKMTMAASIECRAPYMDQELVELSARMPSPLKVRGFTMKYLLKKALEPWLPREILYRKKRGFGAPIGAWLRRDLRDLVADTLSEKQVRERGFLRPSAVQDLIGLHQRNEADCTDHLLALVSLELWFRTFMDVGAAENMALPCATGGSCV